MERTNHAMKPFLKGKKTRLCRGMLGKIYNQQTVVTFLPNFPNSTFASQAQWSRRFLDVRLASFVKPMTCFDLRLTFSFYGEVWWLKKIRISSYHFGMTGFVVSVFIFYFNPPLDVCLASNHSHIFPESKLQVNTSIRQGKGFMCIFYFCWSFLSWKWSLENPGSKHLNSDTYHSKRLQCPSIKRYQHTCERCVPKRSRSRVNHFWNQSRHYVESGSTTLVAVGKS